MKTDLSSSWSSPNEETSNEKRFIMWKSFFIVELEGAKNRDFVIYQRYSAVINFLSSEIVL